jgi:hypothetical protein
MNNSDNFMKKPSIAIFLKIWQIVELVGLLLSIPLIFFAGILFTGDSMTVFNFVNSYILSAVGLLLIIKIIVTMAFFKSKRWALYFNFIQNLILVLLFLGLIIITILAGAFSTIQFVFIFLFLYISWANLKCLRHPFYQRMAKENEK